MPIRRQPSTSRLLVCLCLALKPAVSLAQTANPAISLATFHYPPYIDSKAADQGALVAIVQAALKLEDIPVHITVLPWQRLSSLSSNGRFDGVIGVRRHDEKTLKVRMSQAVFYSVIGFYQRSQFLTMTSNPLAGRRAGVVAGYSYTPVIWQLGSNFDQARDDETNLRKLQQGRIDIAISEKAVGEALIRQNRIPRSPALYWGEVVLAREALSVGFYNGPLQAYWQQAFERGLQKLQHSGRYREIVASHRLQDYAAIK